MPVEHLGIPRLSSGDWRICDLLHQDQVRRSMGGIDVVVHCASNVEKPQDDATALDHLITVAKASALHIVYVSICGIEEASKHFEYYRVKVRNEEALRMSGSSYTIVRISQFHPFAAIILSHLVHGSFILQPQFSLQPIDIGFAARQLATYAASPQINGRVPDVHGPDVLASGVLINSWCKAQGIRKLRIPIPAVGIMKALATLTPVRGVTGGLSWMDWLTQESAQNNPYSKKG